MDDLTKQALTEVQQMLTRAKEELTALYHLNSDSSYGLPETETWQESVKYPAEGIGKALDDALLWVGELLTIETPQGIPWGKLMAEGRGSLANGSAGEGSLQPEREAERGDLPAGSGEGVVPTSPVQ